VRSLGTKLRSTTGISSEEPDFPRPSSSGITGANHYPRTRAKGSLVLIDPKPFTRLLIADMLSETFPEYSVLAVASSEEFLDKINRLQPNKPNFVIIYIRNTSFSNASVQHSLDLINQDMPGVPMIFLADHIDPIELNEAFVHGVRGFIPTTIACDVAVAALKLIDAGGTYVPADALCPGTDKTDSERKSDLTPRELSVLRLIREGNPNKVIASHLEMQESTVKVHVRNILKKLHATNRTHAVSVASRVLAEPAE
jgi:DNA-binding NarL/FixJ family response regulator